MKANDFTAVKAMLTQGANPNAKVGKKGKANPSPTFLFLSATLNLIPIKPLSPFRPARPPAGTRIGMTAMHRVAKVGNRKLELILEDYGGVKIKAAQDNYTPGLSLILNIVFYDSIAPTASPTLSTAFAPPPPPPRSPPPLPPPQSTGGHDRFSAAVT